jgi:SpoVK/Ycf46/Vps4 family AAA+-type ATPase
MNPDQPINKATIQHSIDLPGVVRIVKPAITWEQLSHIPDTLPALKNICQGFKPGKGLMCLFAGKRGTGQTLAAQAIARQLGMALVRVDLSAVVSKYSGETEKNLQRIFDSANPLDSVLFFDEADALFGKRSDVNDSHDRYANIEVNYLLQRMETFNGLAILATNKKQAVASVFVRHLRLVVNFPA